MLFDRCDPAQRARHHSHFRLIHTHVELADEGHDGVLLRLGRLELPDLVALALCGLDKDEWNKGVGGRMDRQHHRPPTLQLWPSFERLGRAYLDGRVELLLGRHACLCACGGVRRAFASSSETLGYRSRLCAACSVGGSGGSWEPLMSRSIFDQPARLVPWFCALVKTKTRRTPATAASSIRASERLWRREAFVARSEPPRLLLLLLLGNGRWQRPRNGCPYQTHPTIKPPSSIASLSKARVLPCEDPIPEPGGSLISFRKSLSEASLV